MDHIPSELLKAHQMIDSYAETLKLRLADEVALYIRNNPGWEFSHIDFKYNESESRYTLTPVFKKQK